MESLVAHSSTGGRLSTVKMRRSRRLDSIRPSGLALSIKAVPGAGQLGSSDGEFGLRGTRLVSVGVNKSEGYPHLRERIE